MNKCYSTVELSKVLGVSARAVTKRAHLEKWKFNNGKRRAYIFQSLPQEVRRIIISKQAGVALDFVPSKNLDVSLAEAGLKKWNKATKYNRKIAQARDHILNRLSEFIETKDLNQGLGEERFAAFFGAGLIKDVAPWVIDKISTVSAPTLRRWRGDREKNGLPGLLGGYGNRKGQRKAVTSEQSAFIVSHIKAKPHIRGEHIFKMICKTFESHPSRRTVYRFINDWKEKNSELFALSEDPRRWKNSYMAAFGDASADVPDFGHTVEMDSTPSDLVDIDGRRLAVIGAIDIFSRRAVMIIAPTSKSIAIAACMRKAMLTWGIFSRVRKDNGKDYQSSHIDAITSALKIETPELPKYSPEKKPYIERFFGTFSRGLEELLPGFCGHSVNERQALREKETWASKIMEPGGVVEIPLTQEEFQSLADRWIEIYERTPHKGLGGKTPLEVS